MAMPCPFLWVDTKGIPLELVVDAFARKGFAPDFVLGAFLLGAVRAGWKTQTVKAVIREAAPMGLYLRPSMRHWAQSA